MITRKYLLMCICVLTGIGLISCTQKEEKPVAKPVKKAVKTDTVSAPKYDYIDIAMYTRSLVDALKMGEQLDSVNYDFTGILTDGKGVPLYTSFKGGPGVWRVHVLSPSSVMMANTELGDLLAEDLRIYLADQLGLTDADVIDAGIAVQDDMTQAVIYRKGNLLMQLTMKPENVSDAKGSNATEAVWMTVTLKKADEPSSPAKKKKKQRR